jgi:membrane protease YdiL (CAAX protease family)
MNQQDHPTPYTRFRLRSRHLLRDNKLFIAAELLVALLIIVAYLAGLLPLSETPYLFFLGWVSLWLHGLGWGAVGFKRPASWRRTILIGIAVGVAYQFLVSYGLEPLVTLLTRKPTDLSQFAPLKGNVSLLLIFLVLVWVIGAFGEELVYRGYLMNRVAELAGGGRRAWAMSLIVVSVLFGVMHLYQGISGIVVNMAAGLIYGALYLQTGRNLWLSIIVHGVYDTVGLLLIFSSK